MLDLRSMSDEEFTVLVTPSVPQTTMHVTVEGSGKILLSSRVAAKLSKIPVRICFNQDYTAMQNISEYWKAGRRQHHIPEKWKKRRPECGRKA